MNGLGERAHIAPLAEVAAVIQLYYGIDCGIKLEKMYELSRLVSDIMKWPMTDTMPFVGKTAFSHLVEVHYCVPDTEEGFWAYSCMKPGMFGNGMHNLLGHYSGEWAIRTKARELGTRPPAGEGKRRGRARAGGDSLAQAAAWKRGIRGHRSGSLLRNIIRGRRIKPPK